MAEKTEFKQQPVPALAAKSLALVSALFVLAVSILLIADHVQLLNMDPLNDPVLLELRAELADSTDDHEEVIEQIRTFDLYARRAFFSSQSRRQIGGLLVLVGTVICFTSLKFNRMWTPRLPDTNKREPVDHWELNAVFRQLLAGTGIFLVAVSLFLAFVVQSDLTTILVKQSAQVELDHAGENGADSGALISRLLPDAMKHNWPSLRGAGNIGVVFTDASDYLITWDVESGEGILWKSEVPVHGGCTGSDFRESKVRLRRIRSPSRKGAV